MGSFSDLIVYILYNVTNFEKVFLGLVMKTFGVFVLILLGSIYEGYCQWFGEDSYKKMAASDTSIIQMEISEDGNFLFIIDKLYNLKKFDAATGNKVSEISLKSVDLGTYKFSNAKLTKGGSQYYVYGDYKDSVLVFIFDIEKDLILNQLYLRRNLFSYQKYGLYNVTIQNDILFLNQIHQYFTSYGKQASSEQWGYSEVYKIQNYTTQLLNMKSGGMERNTLINKNSFFTVYYTDYEDFFMDNLKPLHNFNFRELMLFNRYTNQFRRIKYIEDNKETYNKPNTEMNLSHYGNLSSFQFYDTLFVYDNIKNINIVKEIYKAVISSMTFSNDNKYLIFATGNKIITKTSNDLKKVDSLVEDITIEKG